MFINALACLCFFKLVISKVLSKFGLLIRWNSVGAKYDITIVIKLVTWLVSKPHWSVFVFRLAELDKGQLGCDVAGLASKVSWGMYSTLHTNNKQ